MSKIKKYVLLFAGLVTAFTGFTSCKSDALVDESYPSEERGVVKTEFTISIPQGSSAITRMSSGIVQSAEDLNSFRGIKDIELYPLSSKISTATGSVFPVPETTIPSKILLVGGSAGKSGPSGTSDYTIDGKSNLFSNSQSHLYQDVDIPLGTKSFMFYGEAAGNNAENVQGAIEKTVSGTSLGGITFSPVQIYSYDQSDPFNGTYAPQIAAYLTSIANVSGWKTTNNVALRSLFEQFTGEAEDGTLVNNGIKAGSWTNVKAAVQQLYENLRKNQSGDTEETRTLKDNIITAIKNKSTYGVHDEDNDGVLTFGTLMGVIDNTDPDNPVEKPYPRDLGLPDGAAYVRWKPATSPATGEFEALANNNNTGTNIASLSSYVYPASLYYRVLSNIKTSSTIKGTSGSQAYDDDKDWETILSYYNPSTEETSASYDNESVSSKTRSIVVKNPIQYAVGRLDATIEAGATSIKDNNDRDNVKRSFDVGAASSLFKVTGILIGGQKPVDYKFQQRSDATTFYTIYDNSVEGVYLRSTGSGTIYTLALETKSATQTAQDDAVVKIAVEFENNSNQTIVGKNRELIHPGCRFYLIGTLDPYANNLQKYAFNEKIDDPTNNSLKDPTLNNSDVIKKAFVQDYKTVVTLKIENLENAYNTLPDLTLPQLEMGLSVDLQWQTGITLNIDME